MPCPPSPREDAAKAPSCPQRARNKAAASEVGDAHLSDSPDRPAATRLDWPAGNEGLRRDSEKFPTQPGGGSQPPRSESARRLDLNASPARSRNRQSIPS